MPPHRPNAAGNQQPARRHQRGLWLHPVETGSRRDQIERTCNRRFWKCANNAMQARVGQVCSQILDLPRIRLDRGERRCPPRQQVTRGMAGSRSNFENARQSGATRKDRFVKRLGIADATGMVTGRIATKG